MNISEVTRLLDAGFTKDEIMSLFPQNPQNNTQEPISEHSESEVNKNSENEENAARDPAENKTDQPDAKPEKANIPEIDRLNSTVEKLIRTIQASNLQNNYTGSAGKIDIQDQVDNIMRSIIRPEKKGD